LIVSPHPNLSQPVTSAPDNGEPQDFTSSTFGSPVRLNLKGKVPGPCVKSPDMVLPSAERGPVKGGSPGAAFTRKVHFPFVNAIASSGMPDAFCAGIEIEPIQPFGPLSKSTSMARVWLGTSTEPLQCPRGPSCAQTDSTQAIHRAPTPIRLTCIS